MKLPSSIVACFIAVIISGFLASRAAAAHSPSAHPPSSYLLQVNGQTYREKSPNLRRPPASLTKIMTALVVLENGHMDEVVTVSASASRETGSRIGLRRGDRLKVRDLLAATLIASANDAARALADHLGGNQKTFVKRMNDRARSLKLQDTHFTNACGHDQKGLYTTAHDLAILTEHALGIPLFTELVAQRTMRITTLKGHRSYSLKNKNRLIGRYPGARGVKTGTTPKAGKCLVALAERGNTRVFLVLMNARNRWQIAPSLLDAGFAADQEAKPSQHLKKKPE
jgi:serine-type D-Ala-D-Ala carboxypeptidase (penicillin-binding protein 5/6)